MNQILNFVLLSYIGYQEIILIIIMLVIAIAVGKDAEKRGMNAWGWGIGVFLLLIVFLPLYFILRKPKKTFVKFTNDEFVKVYENLNSSQDDLFQKANEWIVGILKDAKSVIQLADKNKGVILGKYLLNSHNEVYATIDIRVKDDRARLAVTPNDYFYYETKKLSYTKKDAIKDMNRLAQSFYEKIKSEKIDF
jgi:hypothetical protein